MPKVRSVFLSDIHLGTRACQADRLSISCANTRLEQTYLVGDIIDFWAMSRSISWSQAQNTVVQKLLRRAPRRAGGVHSGNHDEALRDYCGIVFGDVEVVDEIVHQTADGRRFLIIHGDVRPGHAPSSLGGGAGATRPTKPWSVSTSGCHGDGASWVFRLLVVGRLRQAQGQDRTQFHFRFRRIGHSPRP